MRTQRDRGVDLMPMSPREDAGMATVAKKSRGESRALCGTCHEEDERKQGEKNRRTIMVRRPEQQWQKPLRALRTLPLAGESTNATGCDARLLFVSSESKSLYVARNHGGALR